MQAIISFILGAIISLTGMLGVQSFGSAGVTGVNSPSYWTLSNGVLKAKNSTWSVATSSGGTGTSTQVTNGVLFYDGTKITSGTALTFTNGALGIATTTPLAAGMLVIASSTGPQLGLSDGSASSYVWTFRSIGNTLYIATSTALATSTTQAAIALLPSGQMQLPMGSASAPSITFNQLNTGIYSSASANIFAFTSNGSEVAQFDQNTFYSANSNGFRFQNASAVSQSQPTIEPDRGSSSTGFGSGTTGQLNAIVTGNEVTRWYKNGFAIGTSTPNANFQVATSTSNATTTLEFGKSGQTLNGTCIKLYRSDGSAIYAYVLAGATAFTLSTTACASVTGF